MLSTRLPRPRLHRGQIWLPGVWDVGAGDADEDRRPRCPGLGAWVHLDLAREPVSLAAVAARAGGDDVLPHRLAAAAARDHVVDGKARLARAAVLAGPGVTRQHRLAGDLATVGVARDPHVGDQPDHHRAIEGEPLRVKRARGPLQSLRLCLQYKYGRAPHGTYVDRLEARVEDEHPAGGHQPGPPAVAPVAVAVRAHVAVWRAPVGPRRRGRGAMSSHDGAGL